MIITNHNNDNNYYKQVKDAKIEAPYPSTPTLARIKSKLKN